MSYKNREGAPKRARSVTPLSRDQGDFRANASRTRYRPHAVASFESWRVAMQRSECCHVEETSVQLPLVASTTALSAEEDPLSPNCTLLAAACATGNMALLTRLLNVLSDATDDDGGDAVKKEHNHSHNNPPLNGRRHDDDSAGTFVAISPRALSLCSSRAAVCAMVRCDPSCVHRGSGATRPLSAVIAGIDVIMRRDDPYLTGEARPPSVAARYAVVDELLKAGADPNACMRCGPMTFWGSSTNTAAAAPAMKGTAANEPREDNGGRGEEEGNTDGDAALPLDGPSFSCPPRHSLPHELAHLDDGGPPLLTWALLKEPLYGPKSGIIERLLEGGARVDGADADTLDTALHTLAAASSPRNGVSSQQVPGIASRFRMLRRLGADVNRRNRMGLTPLEVAVASGAPAAVIDLLRQWAHEAARADAVASDDD